MSKFEEYLVKQHQEQEAFLIDSGEDDRTKDDYIQNAETGIIVAFRLNFESNQGVKLTKVISGKIIENNREKEIYFVETRNGLKYGVPYDAVIWVKTGDRWPRGVYEEMKQGSVEVKDESELSFGELAEVKETPNASPDWEMD